MTKVSAPIAIALAVLAPVAGWEAMGPVLLYSVSTPAFIGAGKDAATPSDKTPQKAIIAASQGAFQSGIEALKRNDVQAALNARDDLVPRDGIERKALTYAIVSSGLPGISSAEYLSAREDLAGWPGLGDLDRQYERALYRERPSDDAIFAAFRLRAPQTPEGTLLYARALKSVGETDRAKGMITSLWATNSLNTWLESEVLSRFSDILTPADHRARMDYLLYRDRIKQAARFAKLGNAQPLYDAWSGVIKQSPKAPQLLKAAEAGFKNDSALLFANIMQKEQANDFDGAATLLQKLPAAASERVNSDEWWHEQRIVSRGLFEQGKIKAAYDLAAGHVAASPAATADAEFHAGWYALIGLNDGKLAKTHFERLLEEATTPQTASRAFYWLGRADKAAGGDGKAYFEDASAYDHSFYGLIAATELAGGAPAADEDKNQPTASDRLLFAGRESVRAIDLLQKANYPAAAKRLYRGLADQIEDPDGLTILAEKAKREQDSALALDIGKKAYAKGGDDAGLAYPLGAIPDTAGLSGTQLALAYAIARQESGFNAQAVSAARAVGLMQILPGTAKDMASQLGLAYAPEKLTADTAYNAILGTQYLDNQIKRQAGSYVLTFAAYNAGPGKVREWLKRFGDPRGKDLEFVLNWVESIPYPETRDYVMRVMENFEAYQLQLGLPANIKADLTAGG
ncbi:lytic transglycosylase domain-containing protein [Rhizobium sp. C1]|uniref:lytic transglycosylase domain-containing protein n=1 Tax=Rhizobium sp. C1 TaxID=1349799 RepID=UPI001E5ED992|nr:lytic transglycosylase domain-containing protein [Rhizobium sp. C1]MCD2177546.1 lytic transglycosylase domain-containing protein [Rhizobium sp. C1]